MKKCFRRSVFILTLSACAASQSVAQERRPLAAQPAGSVQQGTIARTEMSWEKLSPEGSGFAVLFPGKPIARDETLDTAIGILTHHEYTLETGTTYFMVAYVDYPDVETDVAAIKLMLDAGREGGLRATHGVLKSEKDIKLGDYIGREWVIKLPDSGGARARAYWVSSRLYQAVVMLPDAKNAEEEKAREATMSKFLDSFVLTGNSAPK